MLALESDINELINNELNGARQDDVCFYMYVSKRRKQVRMKAASGWIPNGNGQNNQVNSFWTKISFQINKIIELNGQNGKKYYIVRTEFMGHLVLIKHIISWCLLFFRA